MPNNTNAPDDQVSRPRFDPIAGSSPFEANGAGGWSQSGADNADSASGLAPYLHSLRRRWLVAVLVALPLSAIATCAAWFFLPRLYTATAVLRLSPTETKMIFDTADNEIRAGGHNQYEIYKKTQRQLLSGRFVFEKALRDDPDLAKLKMFEDGTDPVEWLEANLKVVFPDESEVMNVSLSANQPDGLHQLVNAMVKAYFDKVVEGDRLRKKNRVESLQKAYENAEQERRDKGKVYYGMAEQVGSSDTAVLTAVQRNTLNEHTAVKQKFDQTRHELFQASAELELQEATIKPQDERDVISDDDVELAMRTDRRSESLNVEREQVLDLVQRTKDALKKKEDGGEAQIPNGLARRLKIIDEKIEVRKAELREELSRHKQRADEAAIAALKKKVDLLTTQEAQLKKNYLGLDTEVRKFSRPSMDVEAMKSDIAVLSEIMVKLGTELERTKVEMKAETKEAKDASSRVVKLSDAQPARVGVADSKSRLTKTIGAGFIWWLLPMALIVWLDARKQRINSGTDVVHGLGLSVIGAVPLVPQRVMRRLDGTSTKDKYWRALLSESVDSIAAVLLRGVRSGTIHSVMVSSANAGEGKTTLAANLATSLAGAGCRTLLVDFDLRRPALHKLFDLPLQPGICDVLRDRNHLTAAIQTTRVSNLGFLAAGRCNAIGLAGLAAYDLNSLFESLRNEYQFIVVDGSPILPVVDTRLIAQHVDTVVLSVLRDVSCVPQVRAAGELLKKFAIPILGVVVTGSMGDAYPGSSSYSPYVVDVQAS